jgi:hypothetical protein
MFFSRKDRENLNKLVEVALAENELILHKYSALLDKQQKLIDGLYDKLMARNLPEYKTFTFPREQEEISYDPLSDESMIGEIGNIETGVGNED